MWPRNLGLGYDKKKKGPATSTSTSNNVNADNDFLDDILEEEAIILSNDYVNLPTLFESTFIFTIIISLRHPNLIDLDLQSSAPINTFPSVETYVHLMVLGEDEHPNYKSKKKQKRRGI